MFYSKIIRPLLFRLSKHDPEIAHEEALTLLAWIGESSFWSEFIRFFTEVPHWSLSQTLWGLQFKNPVGLAAGFDKDAGSIAGCAALGFGFLEVGTVTPKRQPGNPRPRMFRLPSDHALINQMVFNNDGVEELRRTLQQGKRPGVPVGISIGKGKDTPLNGAIRDYLFCLRAVYSYGDYFAVNVSSPNTPGLRQLQDKEFLRDLLRELTVEASKLSFGTTRKPLLVKIAPDLTDTAIAEVLQACADNAIDGIVAVNTTVDREGLTSPSPATGGLSGKPLHDKAVRIIRFIRNETGTKMPIIGVGGIASPLDAYRLLCAGANLVQLYTGLVYEGPMLIGRINRGLVKLFSRDGIENVALMNPLEIKAQPRRGGIL